MSDPSHITVTLPDPRRLAVTFPDPIITAFIVNIGPKGEDGAGGGLNAEPSEDGNYLIFPDLNKRIRLLDLP